MPNLGINIIIKSSFKSDKGKIPKLISFEGKS